MTSFWKRFFGKPKLVPRETQGRGLNEADQMRAAGDLKGALAEYTRLLNARQTPPDPVSIQFHRGLAYRAKGDFGAAIADYERCLSNKRLSLLMIPRLTFYLGNARAANGDVKRAEADHQRLIDACFIEGSAHDCDLSAALPDDLANAVTDCTLLVTQRPESWQAYFCRGLAKRHTGDEAGMRADYAAAQQRIALQPDSRSQRLHEWSLSQALLIKGFPDYHHRDQLLPGARFCSVQFRFDQGHIDVVYYDVNGLQTSQIAESEGDALLRKLRGEGWLALRQESFHDSSEYWFWRPEDGFTA